MAVDQKLNLMIDLDLLLDALERAVLESAALALIVPDPLDDEDRRDTEAAREEAAVRKELIRTRILHKALHRPTSV